MKFLAQVLHTVASGRETAVWDLLAFLEKRKINESPEDQKAWGLCPAARPAWGDKSRCNQQTRPSLALEETQTLMKSVKRKDK